MHMGMCRASPSLGALLYLALKIKKSYRVSIILVY